MRDIVNCIYVNYVFIEGEGCIIFIRIPVIKPVMSNPFISKKTACFVFFEIGIILHDLFILLQESEGFY